MTRNLAATIIMSHPTGEVRFLRSRVSITARSY
jgi:hypothetical protein